MRGLLSGVRLTTAFIVTLIAGPNWKVHKSNGNDDPRLKNRVASLTSKTLTKPSPSSPRSPGVSVYGNVRRQAQSRPEMIPRLVTGVRSVKSSRLDRSRKEGGR